MRTIALENRSVSSRKVLDDVFTFEHPTPERAVEDIVAGSRRIASAELRPAD